MTEEDFDREEFYKKFQEEGSLDSTQARELEDGLYQKCFVDTSLQKKLMIPTYICKAEEIIDALQNGTPYTNTMVDQSPQELQPDKWKLLVDKESLKRMKLENLATTDHYKCPKCKRRKCTVTQVQTRSADEPMTTFVKCVECGHTISF